MKSVIPFTKELDFTTKLSEITSISLEREFAVNESVIEGNLFITGDYKSHEVSANVVPFSFKIPFSIEIPDNLSTDSITLEISDFAYDLMEESKIKVNIELELDGEIKEEVEEEKDVVVDSDEILRMMEEENTEEEPLEDVLDETLEREKEISEPIEEIEKLEEPLEEVEEVENIVELPRNESEDLILENITNESEYATYHIHLVKEGETVETICTLYNSNINLLADYNDVSNLTMGSKMIIPNNDES